jgi:hypothetical protein
MILEPSEGISMPMVVVGLLSVLNIKEIINVSTLQMAVVFNQKLCCSSTRIHGVISKKNPSFSIINTGKIK